MSDYTSFLFFKLSLLLGRNVYANFGDVNKKKNREKVLHRLLTKKVNFGLKTTMYDNVVIKENGVQRFVLPYDFLFDSIEILGKERVKEIMNKGLDNIHKQKIKNKTDKR